MSATPVIVYDPRHVEHRPRLDLQYGRPTPNPERPARVEALIAFLSQHLRINKRRNGLHTE